MGNILETVRDRNGQTDTVVGSACRRHLRVYRRSPCDTDGLEHAEPAVGQDVCRLYGKRESGIGVLFHHGRSDTCRQNGIQHRFGTWQYEDYRTD